MEIKIEGNPGTGNTYVETKIGHIENNFPAVTEVTIIQGHDGKKIITKGGEDGSDQSSSAANPEFADNTQALRDAKRQDIIKYVSRTLPLVNYLWKDKYMSLWYDILDIPEVDAVIYKKGHQQHTSFNRKEVLHIICYLGKHAAGGIGIFADRYVASAVALQLNDGCEKTTRPELGFKPTFPIQKAIDKLMDSKKYQLKRKDGSES